MQSSMQPQTYKKYQQIKPWHLQVKILWKNQVEFQVIKDMSSTVNINFRHQDLKKIILLNNYQEDRLQNDFHQQSAKDQQKENKNYRSSINNSLLNKHIKMKAKKISHKILRFQLSNLQILEVLVPTQKLQIPAEVEMMVRIYYWMRSLEHMGMQTLPVNLRQVCIIKNKQWKSYKQKKKQIPMKVQLKHKNQLRKKNKLRTFKFHNQIQAHLQKLNIKKAHLDKEIMRKNHHKMNLLKNHWLGWVVEIFIFNK